LFRLVCCGCSGDVPHDAGRPTSSDADELLRALNTPDPDEEPGNTDEPHRWFDEHKDHIATVLPTTTADRPPDAARLLAKLWPLVPHDADLRWCRTLHTCGTELAHALPHSTVLAEAFRRGAHYFRTRGEYRLAVAQGRGELAIRRRLTDRQAHEAALLSLSQTYRAQGRLHRVVDCADEILENHIVENNPAGIARTLGLLGGLMAEAGRTANALHYYTRAATLCATLADTPGRARWQIHIGRLLWTTGDTAAARRQFRQTLTLVADLDPTTTTHLHELLATPDNGTLPDSTPGSASTDRPAAR